MFPIVIAALFTAWSAYFLRRTVFPKPLSKFTAILISLPLAIVGGLAGLFLDAYILTDLLHLQLMQGADYMGYFLMAAVLAMLPSYSILKQPLTKVEAKEATPAEESPWSKQ